MSVTRTLPCRERTAHAQPLREGGARAGRRADLLRVRVAGGLPVIRGVWVEGERA
jgi:alpha-D-ribose 1-methylphosphonate 5-triphosphate diphosphatase PhnM